MNNTKEIPFFSVGTDNKEIINILLVYPAFPKTFWSFDYALKFISKKASMPPLGLLTIASMLPRHWNRKLVDVNTTVLSDKDIGWADYVFLSAMDIQSESAREILARCKQMGVATIAGGPLFSEFDTGDWAVDHLLLGEGELSIPLFLEDLKNGKAKKVYQPAGYANLENTPLPSWELLNTKQYACMSVQYSRGCPFNCEFCDVTALFGHEPRTKTKQQLMAELEVIYKAGWRGGIFFVDDNFIGNRKKLKTEILPALIDWTRKKKHPFTFLTETSINLADDEELMQLMRDAGFKSVFIGIETVSEESLDECNKTQNKNRDLLSCVKKIQQFGLQVQGGFIVGFDSDKPQIFRKMIDFIQDSGIVTAMVGLLNAPRRTRLFERLSREGRILSNFSGNNTDLSINFVPKMNISTLLDGYREIVKTIYSPKQYARRVKNFLIQFKPAEHSSTHITIDMVAAFFKATLLLGCFQKERVYYWKLFFWSLLHKPAVFSYAISFSIYGYHFRKIFEGQIASKPRKAPAAQISAQKTYTFKPVVSGVMQTQAGSQVDSVHKNQNPL